MRSTGLDLAFTMPFTGKKTDWRLNMAAAMPILAAFRRFLEVEPTGIKAKGFSRSAETRGREHRPSDCGGTGAPKRGSEVTGPRGGFETARQPNGNRGGFRQQVGSRHVA
jgi:hypothetical protein